MRNAAEENIYRKDLVKVYFDIHFQHCIMNVYISARRAHTARNALAKRMFKKPRNVKDGRCLKFNTANKRPITQI